MGASKTNIRKSNGHKWRTVSAQLRDEGRGCWICRAFGRPDFIDYSLPPLHPDSFEVDHLVPTSKGGSLYDYDNLDATHRRCNIWRKNKSVAEVLAIARRSKQTPQVTPTTDW